MPGETEGFDELRRNPGRNRPYTLKQHYISLAVTALAADLVPPAWQAELLMDPPVCYDWRDEVTKHGDCWTPKSYVQRTYAFYGGGCLWYDDVSWGKLCQAVKRCLTPARPTFHDDLLAYVALCR